MKLIVGLGNPGNKYALTRHNIGFMAVDALANRLGADRFRSEHRAEVVKTSLASTPLLLVKPQTYMNLSGESVRPIMDFYKIAPQDILVLHDEVDLPFSSMKLQKARGHGGHNGVRNIHQILGTNDYARLRLGVGKPLDPRFAVADYVLQNFSGEEMSHMRDYLNMACEAIELWIQSGFDKAATTVNQRKEP